MIDLNKIEHYVVGHEEKGLLTKYWVVINDQRYLFKTNYLFEQDAVTKTNFGEVLYYQLSKKLNFPCVEAELAVGNIDGKEVEGVLIKSFLKNEMEDSMGYKDMVNVISKYGYSPKHENNIEACVNVGYYMAKYQYREFNEEQTKKDLAKLCVVDYFLGQGDRHGRNIEYIFDEEFRLRLAPFFDNGFCLGFKYTDGIIKKYLSDPTCRATNDYFGDPAFFYVKPYERLKEYDDKDDSRHSGEYSNVLDIIDMCKEDKELAKLVQGFLNLDIRKELEAMNNNSRVKLPKSYIDFSEIIYNNRVKYFNKLVKKSLNMNDKGRDIQDEYEMGR